MLWTLSEITVKLLALRDLNVSGKTSKGGRIIAVENEQNIS